MHKALALFETLESKKLKKDEMLLIKVRYLLSLSGIYYIKGNYAEALKQAEAAERICANDKQFTYDTI